MPANIGEPAIRCLGPSYAPGPYNRLKQCLPCPSGFATPLGFTKLQMDKHEVCQVPPGRLLETGVVRDCPNGLYRSGSVPVDDKREVDIAMNVLV
jgi:hypothetical protein